MTSIILAVCLAGLSSSYLHTAHIHDHRFCFAHSPHSPSAHLHNQIVSYMGIPVPACFMIVTTLLIVYEIRKHQKNRWSNFLQSSRTAECSDSVRNQWRNEARAEVALTIMLLTATLVFVLLSFPLFIYIVSPPDFDPKHPVDQALSFIYLEVAKGLEVFSHTLNFFIYFLSARKFRNRLLITCGVPTNVVKSLKLNRRKRTLDTSHSNLTDNLEHRRLSSKTSNR